MNRKSLLLRFACPEGFGSAPVFHRCRNPLWPPQRPCGGTMTTGQCASIGLLAGNSLHRFRYPRRNAVRRERLVDGGNNRFVSPQTRLGNWYAMTPFVFPAASTGARCVSNNDFHGSPFEALRSCSRGFPRIRNRVRLRNPVKAKVS